MSDDHAHWASGCYGNRELVTPAMDYLASSGALLPRAYTPNPVCSPARACFFTGRFPSQHGMHDYLKEDTLTHKPLDGERLLPEYLREVGYTTGLVGKWHCGSSHLPQPGFDYWFSYRHGQLPHRGRHHFTENGRDIEGCGQQAPILTERAVNFIRQRTPDQPFFLFVGYVDTHSPFGQHPERWTAHYSKASFEDIPEESWTPPPGGWIRFGVPADPAERREWLIQYYASVSMIDEQIGRLLDELEAQGELDNTLIVYTSDHGHMNGHHGLYTKGNATVPQNLLDESVHVPCLLRWPGHIEAGLQPDFMSDHCDLFQTLLDAANATPTSQEQALRRFPGRSYLGALRQTSSFAKALQFFEYGNARCVFDGRMKFICHYPAGELHFPNELYDLENDPRERHNLATSPGYTQQIARLDEALTHFFSAFEEPEHSGRTILNTPRHNPFEPWRLSRPEKTSPEGSEIEALRHRTLSQ